MEQMEAKVKSLHKALQVLDCFAGDGRELGITEISNALGLLKSTVHNIVQTFESDGYLAKNSKTGKYYLGLKILELSHAMLRDLDIRQIAQPHMVEVARMTGETCHLACCLDKQVLYIETVWPENTYLTRSIIGLKAPLYCTGIGKAILAFMPDAFVREVMADGYVQFTQNTLMSDEALWADLMETRDRGYAVDQMEHEYGVKCVGVPILNNSKNPVAALSVTGPSLRFMDDTIRHFAGILQASAAKIGAMV